MRVPLPVPVPVPVDEANEEPAPDDAEAKLGPVPFFSSRSFASDKCAFLVPFPLPPPVPVPVPVPGVADKGTEIAESEVGKGSEGDDAADFASPEGNTRSGSAYNISK